MADIPICAVTLCGKPVYCKTLCRSHYNHAYVPIPCAIKNCIWKNGLCKKHFRRMECFGDPLIEPGPTPFQKLIQQAVKCKDKNCLVFPSGGAKRFIRANGRTYPVARYVCELAHGKPPSIEHEAAHSCGRKIRKLLESGKTQKYVATFFDVSENNIKSIKARRTWGWLD